LTLVELMLALLGLSLLLNVILASISAGLQAERNAEFRGVAIRLVASEMAKARMMAFADLGGLEAPERQVMVDDHPYRLTTRVRFQDELCQIVTSVTWKAGRRHLAYEAALIRSRL
jgi:hypothetical protein